MFGDKISYPTETCHTYFFSCGLRLHGQIKTSVEHINLISETNFSFESCNQFKRLGHCKVCGVPGFGHEAGASVVELSGAQICELRPARSRCRRRRARGGRSALRGVLRQVPQRNTELSK